jgi:NAD+ diphosphatase
MSHQRSDFRHITPQLMLDRAGEKRRDAAWCEAQLRSPDARFYLLADLAVAITSDPDLKNARLRLFTPDELRRFDPSEACLLGLQRDGTPVFSLGVPKADAIAGFGGENHLPAFVELRVLAIESDISPEELTLAAQARSMAAWHDTHRHCGRCGARTRPRDGGWRRHCWACGHHHFPRFDPAVIMLIQHGERCLLGHEPRFRDGMYSVLAGFVEPGDDIETAVRREIMEEVAIRVGRVRYVASQPWPFPHSLMIGCWGEALSEEIVPDPAEIEDARWFSRDEVLRMMAGMHEEGLTVPPPLSISHTLIRAFAEDRISEFLRSADDRSAPPGGGLTGC